MADPTFCISEGIKSVGCDTLVFRVVEGLGGEGVLEMPADSGVLWTGGVEAGGRPKSLGSLVEDATGAGSHLGDAAEMLWDDGKSAGFTVRVTEHSLDSGVDGT